MGAFFKKDILVFYRDRKQVLIPLILPIILIVVMGFLVPDWFGSSTSSLQAKVAYVVKDDAANGLQQFQDSLAAKGMKAEEAAAVGRLAKEIQPTKLLNDLLASKPVADMIERMDMKEEEALLRLKAEEIDAIVILPEQFTRHVLDKMLLGEGKGASIRLVAEEPTMEVSVLQGIIESFTQQLNTDAAITYAGRKLGSIGEMAWQPNVGAIGGMEQIEGVKTVTTKQYFTLSISVIFTLFASIVIANKATTEKREQVFQRILLSGSRPLAYLAGKASSALVLAIVQLLLVIVVSHFVLNVFTGFSLQFWFGFILLTFMLCLFIGAMSGLFTALMLRINTNIANAIIQSILLMLGILGGSFVPVYILPDSMQRLWEWTPNGFWLSTMTQWIQQQSWDVVTSGLFGLALFTAVTVVLSVWIFPKRGRI
ncbi:ABC transporter permease [Paenibacillus sp. SC116]|uniref:ABC transporter permease n=1 Tax=Paenibacillus sp. SC116 TaxID=2968986 RepID=UPI00215B47AE|nr:ABC transporter permease [Paenibacillus sp. SC116]MCR8842332.1 ABC transporter permease [Paenibacillus sp. SC116]